MAKKNSKTILAQKLKLYRKQANLTQEEISEAIGVNRSAYAYYEIGSTTPKPETIYKLAKIYNISSDEFFSENNFAVAQEEDGLKGNLPAIDVSFNDLSDLEKKMVVKMRLMSTSKLKEFIELVNRI